MATSTNPQRTDFTLDILGRYVCNGLDEALRSADRNLRPDARPFTIIVIGGGSFGPVLAQHLFSKDNTRSHRILVLEAGPVTLPEHLQNLPMQGDIPVWGLPWRTNVPGGFPGLAYCVGGRSIFFGGWSPELLAAETQGWPSSVVSELRTPGSGGSPSYFRQASEQIGVNVTNDFIRGALHEALRQKLFDGISAGKVTGAIPLTELPLVVDDVPLGQEDLFKLEAPLAVQSSTRAGFFPFNKFSAVPLLIKAARDAWVESAGDDLKKRFMIVPNCHVTRLVTAASQGMKRVTEVLTSLGPVPVAAHAVVVIALGTIESARLALLSFEGIPNYQLIGRNLMAHLRSNLVIRIPRAALPSPLPRELQASALFVKGRHTHADGSVGHFHLQITASGLDKPSGDSEAELFKKVPDYDTFDVFREADDNTIVVTIRGIGEMEPQNPDSHVTRDLDPKQNDEFVMRRAFVSMADPQDPQQRANNARSAKDFALWNAMDKAADDVAKVFAGTQTCEVLTAAGFQEVVAGDPQNQLPVLVPYRPKAVGGRRDGLGTTHHEAGTLWMGDNPSTSVTNSDGRFHEVANVYVAGPALFPAVGSPNPMLTGVALARRTADHLVERSRPVLPSIEPGFRYLFNGSDMRNWRMSTIKNQPPGRTNPGSFIVVDGTLESVGGNELGLLWCTEPMPANFILQLEWLRWRHEDNSGVFIRFPHPDTTGYNNTAFVAVHFGFEVQIDELGRPDGADMHATGAIYNEPSQTLTLKPARPAGLWNDFEIRVQGQTYTVFLNGDLVSQFQNPDANRGLPSAPNAPSFIGLQAYPGSRVAFRHIRIKEV